MNFHLDYETYSRAPIKKVGGFRYAEDASTQILLCAIAKGDEPPVIWDAFAPSKENLPALGMLSQLSFCANVVYAHNAPFEVAVSQALFWTTFEADPPAISQWRCTQAMARRAALPQSLGELGEVLKLPIQKDKRGEQLIKIFCQPRTTGKLKGQRILPTDEGMVTLAGEKVTIADAWKLFRRYCIQDVKTEREIHKVLAPFELRGRTLKSFHFDMGMNLRGLPVNVEALRNAKRIVDDAGAAEIQRFRELTGFNPSQPKLLPWLRERGYTGNDLQEATMSAVIDDPPAALKPAALEALQIRARVSFASVKKIPAMLAIACRDNRVKGSLSWSGAVRTHRWSGKLIQPQNFKRPVKHLSKHTPAIYAAICDGWDHEMISLVWGNPIEATASSIRHFIQEPDCDMLDADYRNIEARITPWLAGQEDLLQAFRDGRDCYVEMAAHIFSKPEAEVNDGERFVGKQAILLCIAEGSLVLTNKGLVPIEKVSSCHQVWDGVGWVHHEGVIYKGQQHTIKYQGVLATPDHKVFTDQGGRLFTVSLWGASHFGIQLVTTGCGDTVRESYNCKPENCEAVPLQICECSVPVWVPPIGQLRQPCVRESGEMLQMRGSGTGYRGTTLAYKEDGGGKSPLSESKQFTVSQLWGQGDTVPVQNRGRCSSVDYEQHRPGTGQGSGPEEQQWPLRTREYPVVNQGKELSEYPEGEGSRGFCVCCGGLALLSVQGSPVSKNWNDTEADSGSRKEVYQREAQGVATYEGVLPVFDIVNAGPHNRFTVSNVLVHNCGFQGGWEKFQETCERFGQIVTDDICKLTVDTYREKNDKIASLWKVTQRAAVEAIKNPGHKFAVRGKITYSMAGSFPFPALLARLPSGHCLVYPWPKLKTIWMFNKKKYRSKEEAQAAANLWKRQRAVLLKAGKLTQEEIEADEPRVWSTQAISFMGPDPITKKWGERNTYGGSLVENCVQAIAGDFISYGALKAEAAGYRITFLVHDQALAQYHPEKGNTPDGFKEALCQLPAWAGDFPLDAEVKVSPYYTK